MIKRSIKKSSPLTRVTVIMRVLSFTPIKHDPNNTELMQNSTTHLKYHSPHDAGLTSDELIMCVLNVFERQKKKSRKMLRDDNK